MAAANREINDLEFGFMVFGDFIALVAIFTTLMFALNYFCTTKVGIGQKTSDFYVRRQASLKSMLQIFSQNVG
jgi:hypothetical protein